MYYRGKETKEICEIAFCLSSEGAALFVLKNLFYDENEESEDMDTFDVYCFAGNVTTAAPIVWAKHVLNYDLLQAKSQHALSSRDPSVTSLKHCWDMLKCENKTFLTIVTSAFPCSKDQETLLNELRHAGNSNHHSKTFRAKNLYFKQQASLMSSNCVHPKWAVLPINWRTHRFSGAVSFARTLKERWGS